MEVEWAEAVEEGGKRLAEAKRAEGEEAGACLRG